MRKTPVCPFQKSVLLCTITILIWATVASAQTRNRIARPLSGDQTVAVMDAHPMAQPNFDQGPVNRSMPIHRAAMVFKLAPEQQAALETLA